MTRNPRAFLPLRPVELQLMLALADGDLHGYGLTLAVAERSGGVIHLEPGNLYRIVKRLLAVELVAEIERRPAPDLGDARRRYYQLTEFGARVLAAELSRLKELTASAAALAHVRRWAT